MLIVLIFSCFSCNKPVDNEGLNNNENEYNLPVEKEEFENLDVAYSHTTHMTYRTEQELYDDSDYVFIGMPTDTFTECETIYYDAWGNHVKPEDNVRIADYSTLRNVKIIEMIKGELDSDTIKVADMAAVVTKEDNSRKIVGLPSGTFIQKKNVKYIYYVKKANDKQVDYYFASMDDGLLNIDGLHTSVNEGIDEYFKMPEMQKKYADKFEKYDRSSEVLESK